jgi:hypothetical protein
MARRTTRSDEAEVSQNQKDESCTLQNKPKCEVFAIRQWQTVILTDTSGRMQTHRQHQNVEL